MTYGVYTEDLNGCSLSGMNTVEGCKPYCYKGRVICSEKRKKSDFEVRLRFHRWWGFRIRFRLKLLELGWVTINYGWNYYTGADKIVWRPENKEEK